MTSSVKKKRNYIYSDDMVNTFAQVDDKIYKLMTQTNALDELYTVAEDYVVNTLQPQIVDQLEYLENDLEEWEEKQAIKRLTGLVLEHDGIYQDAKRQVKAINNNIRKIKRRVKWLKIKWKLKFLTKE